MIDPELQSLMEDEGLDPEVEEEREIAEELL